MIHLQYARVITSSAVTLRYKLDVYLFSNEKILNFIDVDLIVSEIRPTTKMKLDNICSGQLNNSSIILG